MQVQGEMWNTIGPWCLCEALEEIPGAWATADNKTLLGCLAGNSMPLLTFIDFCPRKLLTSSWVYAWFCISYSFNEVRWALAWIVNIMWWGMLNLLGSSLVRMDVVCAQTCWRMHGCSCLRNTQTVIQDWLGSQENVRKTFGVWREPGETLAYLCISLNCVVSANFIEGWGVYTICSKEV